MAERDKVFLDPGIPDLYYDQSTDTFHAPNFAGRSGGYVLNFGSAGNAAYGDAQDVYIGHPPTESVGTGAVRRVYIPRSGTIRVAYLVGYFNTAGSGEGWLARIVVNNSGFHSIATVAGSSTVRLWANSNLAVAVVVGDYIEILLSNPTWATNPANGQGWSASIYIE